VPSLLTRRSELIGPAEHPLAVAAAAGVAERPGPRNDESPAVSEAFVRCAEEDSNLHPVSPDQALNAVEV
jgi:hypothetical protein